MVVAGAGDGGCRNPQKSEINELSCQLPTCQAPRAFGNQSRESERKQASDVGICVYVGNWLCDYNYN